MFEYLVKLRCRTTEVMLLTVEAESLLQAREIAEANVRANNQQDKSHEVDVSIFECHRKVE